MAFVFRTAFKRGYSQVKPWHFTAAAYTRRQQCHTESFLYGMSLTHSYQIVSPKLHPAKNPLLNFCFNSLASKSYATSASPKLQSAEGTSELAGAGSDGDYESQSENDQKLEDMVLSAGEDSSDEETEVGSAESLATEVIQGSSPLDSGDRKAKFKQRLDRHREKVCEIVEKNDIDMEESLNKIGITLKSGLLRNILFNLTSPKPALRFFEWAKAQPGFEHKSATYDELANIIGRSEDFETLQKLLAEKTGAGCISSARTFAFAAAWHDNPALLNKVMEVINKMEDFERRNAYDMLIATFCKEDHIDVAMSVLQTMESVGCTPIQCTFRPFLLAYCRNEQYEKVHEVFRLMKEKGCSPDTPCYNIVLSSLCQKEHFAEAAEFLRAMVNSSDGRPDAVTYDILILGAAKRGKMEGALQLFSRMKEDGFKPLYPTYSHLTSGFLQAGDFDKAYLFVSRESGKDHILDEKNYTRLVRACSRSGKVEHAHSILMEMKAKDLNPSRRLCNEVMRQKQLIQAA